MTEQNTYAAILATPCSVADIVAGDILWAASKSTLSVCFVLLLTALFRLIASPLALALVPVGFLVGLMFGGLGMMVTARAPSYDFLTTTSRSHLGDVPLLGGLLPAGEPAAWARSFAWLPAAHPRVERVPGARQRHGHARPGRGARVDGDPDRRRLRDRGALGQAARAPLIA